jgi:exosortase
MKPVARSGSIVAALAWCLVITLPFIVFYHVTSRLLAVWFQVGTYSHGPLMAGMAVLLILRALAASKADTRRPPTSGLVALSIGAVLLVASQKLQFETGSYAALPWLVYTSIWTVGGWSRAKAGLVGIALLLLAMPIWDPLATVLQHVAVLAVSTIMATTATPVFVEGVFIHIPEGVFAVETGCSGIAYFIVAVGLALFITGRDGWPFRDAFQLGILFASLAIVTNCVRISALIALGRITDMRSPLIYDHYVFGWLLFGAVVLPAIWVASRRTVPPAETVTAFPQSGPRVLGVASCGGVLAIFALLA